MNKISNFDEFYDKKLSPYLSELKKQNNSAVNWSMVLVFGPFVLIPLFTISFSNVFESYLKLIVTAVVILIFVAIYKYTSINDSCEEKFKKQAGKIISFIYPGLTYKPDKFSNSIDYKRSSLYWQYYADYFGDDLLEGTYKTVTFKCSEMYTTTIAVSLRIYWLVNQPWPTCLIQ